MWVPTTVLKPIKKPINVLNHKLRRGIKKNKPFYTFVGMVPRDLDSRRKRIFDIETV